MSMVYEKIFDETESEPIRTIAKGRYSYGHLSLNFEGLGELLNIQDGQEVIADVAIKAVHVGGDEKNEQ
jgi:hypothetical protein